MCISLYSFAALLKFEQTLYCFFLFVCFYQSYYLFHLYLFISCFKQPWPHPVMRSSSDHLICHFFPLCFFLHLAVIELGDVDPNCPSNCQIHNTHFFGTDRQIIRRGQAFNFYASFHNREWDDSVDQATFTVETGSHFQNLYRFSQSFSAMLYLP